MREQPAAQALPTRLRMHEQAGDLAPVARTVALQRGVAADEHRRALERREPLGVMVERNQRGHAALVAEFVELGGGVHGEHAGEVACLERSDRHARILVYIRRHTSLVASTHAPLEPLASR
ncbi:hypothetical protein [Xanthomonas sp. XNM01]|uniref:hypothetical protein n=1 Tax=Xanthomonas sp. XNM01 TaxID=2769289 RepID=UPI001CE038FD|nr:hypothetical protein [Xanthomonas sp. XNM01]